MFHFGKGNKGAGLKTLYLVRHAKSDWADLSLDDHDRPLNARGRAAAQVMGAHLAKLGITPDLVLCSTATRAKQTLTGLMAGAQTEWPHAFERRLYEAGTRTLMDLIRRQDPRRTSVMLVGHNPGMQDLAIQLAGEGQPEALARLYKKVPTGTFLELALGCRSFMDISAGCARLVSFIRPKSLTKA